MSSFLTSLLELARLCSLYGLILINGLNYYTVFPENINLDHVLSFNMIAGLYLALVYPYASRTICYFWLQSEKNPSITGLTKRAPNVPTPTRISLAAGVLLEIPSRKYKILATWEISIPLCVLEHGDI
ncbi:hypothetical protein BDW74DRAFT_181366 [Aspergillus multicolor]|uniref:uncharacterized protein n=1 Tax=Aspergillus multicolor TaxID=41759 RepID=UPI003CCD6916